MAVAPKAKWTRGVERKAAFVAACSPFAEASQTLRELAGLEVSSSQIDRIAQHHGALLDEHQRQAEEVWRAPVSPWRPTPQPEISCERLVIQADATSVLTVVGEEHKSVYCATAFDLEARGKSGDRPFVAHRLYTASARNMEDFGDRVKALGWRSGMRGARVAFVGDGARCLWGWAEENLPRGTVFIQDFWHVLEHLAQLAQVLYGEAWAPTFERWRHRLRQGHIEGLLRTLRGLRPKLRGKRRLALDEELVYLRAGRHRMDYARYEQAGWPIGSGAIEGTCKHLIKARFGVTGARWRRRNIHKTLALRLALFNHEWEEYWTRPQAA